MRKLIGIMALALSLAGCTTKVNMVETLLAGQEISLTWKGVVQVSYSPETFQSGYNDARNEYRVYDDRLAYWFTVSCSEKPVTEGQVLTADIAWTGEDRTREVKEAELRVEKVDEEGRIWLWNQSNSIGIIIKNL